MSNFGRVKSLDRYITYIQTNQHNKDGKIATKFNKGKVLSFRKTKSGYNRVGLSNEDHYVHRLVASTFIRELNDKEEVNHIDGNKSNNKVTNLEICTRCENQDHAYMNGLNTLVQKSIKIMVNGEKYDSLGEASRHIGLTTSCISTRVKNIKNNKKNNCRIKNIDIELV